MNILIELDAETYRRLERVAPAKSRKRSAFIRAAIQKSLWELEEERTRRAYLQMPGDEPAPFDPDMWQPLPYGGFDPPREQHRLGAGRAQPAPKHEAKRKAGRRVKARTKKKSVRASRK